MSGRRILLHDLGAADWDATQAIYHTQAELGLPSLNIVWPARPYVCIGRFQDLGLEVDTAECQRRGLPIIRREVGGGAVYLDGRQVFYQLVLPLTWLGDYDYRWLFGLGLEGVVLSLKRLGVEASIRGANDVVVGQRKISGNGAGEVGRSAVVVGNILVDFDYETMAAVLRVPDEKFRDKAYRSMKDNLVTMEDLAPGLGNGLVASAMRDGFAEGLAPRFDLTPAPLPAEVPSAMPAVTARLMGEDWLHSVRHRHERRRLRIRHGLELRQGVWKAPGGLLRGQSAVEDGRIAWAALSGDFFIHPATALAELEQALTGVPLQEVAQAAAAFMSQPGIVMPGVSPDDIARVVTGA